MAKVTSDDLKKWARGVPHDAVDEEGEDVDASDLDDDEGEEDAEPNGSWAGTDSRSDEELAAMSDDECEEHCDWLEENEPDLYVAMSELVTDERDRADGGEDGGDPAGVLAALQAAEQYLTPEYPAFTEAQREAFAENATKLSATIDDPKRVLCVAMIQARRSPEAEAEEEGAEGVESEVEEDEPATTA